MTHLKEGDKAPNFEGIDQNGQEVKLSDFIGKKVILYFYPKDNTPACTIENQDFAANYQRFRAKNTLVFGISRDSLENHERFKDAQALPFELISDEDSRLCELFGVLREKEFFGKTIIRIVFQFRAPVCAGIIHQY